MKKTALIIKIVCAALIFAIGVVVMLLGIFSNTGFSFFGQGVQWEYYGGDAYAGIQHASATTANNVRLLGEAAACAVERAYFWIGILLMVIGAYLFACSLANIEFKNEYVINMTTTEKKSKEPEDAAIAHLAKYKGLLDEGAITQEEFDAKKKQLLGL